MDDLLADFLADCREGLAALDADLVELERRPDDRELVARAFRVLHTIKGTAGFLGLDRLGALAHALETVLAGVRDGMLAVTAERIGAVLAGLDRLSLMVQALEAQVEEPPDADAELLALLALAAGGEPPAVTTPPATLSTGDALAVPAAPAVGSAAAETLRVPVELLDSVVTQVGELALVRNQLLQVARGEERLRALLQRLDHITGELHHAVLGARLQPIGLAWARLPRLVRELGHELGKPIELVTRGQETRLDRQLVELLKDPLLHLVRNAADHGLEPPAERRAAGKPELGRISVEALQQDDRIIVRIADDGRGLDPRHLRRAAAERGVCTAAEAAALDDRAALALVLRPGFSTAASVSNLSGRGVGLDVVRTNLERIGGRITIDSGPGQGTCFTLSLPMTLAILPALIVGVAGRRFALPQAAVAEIMAAAPSLQSGLPLISLRGRPLPVVALDTALEIAATPSPPAQLVVLRVGRYRFALGVDRVFETEEIVVKPLAPPLRAVPRIAGAAILGDGGVVLVLDLAALAERLPDPGEAPADRPHDEPAAAAERTKLLLFETGDDAAKALPLDLVTRIEELPAERIDRAGDRPVIPYGERLMPLVRLDDRVPLPRSGTVPVIVLTDAERHLGLIIERVVGLAEATPALELAAARPGLLGSALVDGRAVDLVDVGGLVTAAFGGWFAPAAGAAHEAALGTAGRHVLLVDDSSFFRKLLVPILEGAGYEVTTAASATEALQRRAAGERFDVILSDIEMPGMDGFDFATACRADGPWRALPLVALSSHDTEADRERGRAAGFAAHVGKLDRPALFAALRRLAAAR